MTIDKETGLLPDQAHVLRIDLENPREVVEARLRALSGNQGREKITLPPVPTATRWKLNRNWSWRGDNTKYKEKK